jgi:hypothetical protein
MDFSATHTGEQHSTHQFPRSQPHSWIHRAFLCDCFAPPPNGSTSPLIPKVSDHPFPADHSLHNDTSIRASHSMKHTRTLLEFGRVLVGANSGYGTSYGADLASTAVIFMAYVPIIRTGSCHMQQLCLSTRIKRS